MKICFVLEAPTLLSNYLNLSDLMTRIYASWWFQAIITLTRTTNFWLDTIHGENFKTTNVFKVNVGKLISDWTLAHSLLPFFYIMLFIWMNKNVMNFFTEGETKICFLAFVLSYWSDTTLSWIFHYFFIFIPEQRTKIQ